MSHKPRSLPSSPLELRLGTDHFLVTKRLPSISTDQPARCQTEAQRPKSLCKKRRSERPCGTDMTQAQEAEPRQHAPLLPPQSSGWIRGAKSASEGVSAVRGQEEARLDFWKGAVYFAILFYSGYTLSTPKKALAHVAFHAHIL